MEWGFRGTFCICGGIFHKNCTSSSCSLKLQTCHQQTVWIICQRMYNVHGDLPDFVKLGSQHLQKHSHRSHKQPSSADLRHACSDTNTQPLTLLTNGIHEYVETRTILSLTLGLKWLHHIFLIKGTPAH